MCTITRGNLYSYIRCGVQLHSSSFTGVILLLGCMHRKHFFVPATGAPAGDYELYLLGLDWLPEAIQPCCASGECGSSAPFVTGGGGVDRGLVNICTLRTAQTSTT